MTDRPIYHRTEILAELRREYAWRRRLYPGWVQQGRMRQQDADRQMQILDQVIQEYARRDMDSDLFAVRMVASAIAAEVCTWAQQAFGQNNDVQRVAQGKIADRIARAMKEGK